MCQNSSSTSDFLSGSLFQQLLWCLHIRVGWYSSLAFFSVNLLVVLPICVAVLYLGCQQLKQVAKISHTDAFTYHVSAIQILGTCASFVSVIGRELCNDILILVGIYMIFANSFAFLMFQCLTCAERYIAVVYPLTYLRLKKQTLARNIICGLIWLQCMVQGVCFAYVVFPEISFVFVNVGIALIFGFILFCNISVLVALLRPHPGDGARKNKSTQRAFYTISAIFGTLVLKGLGDIVSNITSIAVGGNADILCGLWLSVAWFNLPSNIILQILFLHRAGKLPCCRRAQTNTAD